MGLLWLAVQWPLFASPYGDIEPIPVNETTGNEVCLDCHGVDGFAVPKGATGQAPKRHLSFDPERYGNSAHGERRCVECHTDIRQTPHKPALQRAVDCVSCHRKMKREVSRNSEQSRTLDDVVAQADHFLASVHAQPDKDDPSKPNATCIDCHEAHYTFAMESQEGQAYRMTTPEVCGRCHADVVGDYRGSVHGLAAMRFGDPDAAVCADCHTAHEISDTGKDPAKVAITRNCGDCHKAQYESYRHTYHGQVHRLGYGHTAKCYDCHAHHATLKPDDPDAKMAEGKRLETCRECHENASQGFLSFYPHGTTDDYDNYPEMWIASKFMIALVIVVFAFFWTHSLLWFYREWQDRRAGNHHLMVNEKGEAMEAAHRNCVHVRRFSWQWRLAHLVLAVAVMALVLTGTAVLYADAFWAPTVMQWIGGPKVAAVIHRIGAVAFAIIFFGHIAVSLYNTLIKGWGTFRWFGPYSLLPRWQDFKDAAAMFRWFLGKGPRPVFDHWTYWEKFDYWAPFWGMFIIGVSGVMLWFNDFTSQYLPGWVFNVATIVHGEEAFLAAVFLFTVHYFNCHFRPDKLPQDIVMFTGTTPLEEFKAERQVEYQRLVASGKLADYLVEEPGKRMTFWSKVLGAFLILFGLLLLGLVSVGFWQTVLFN